MLWVGNDMEILNGDYSSVFFIDSTKHLLSTYCVPNSILGNAGIAVNKKSKTFLGLQTYIDEELL